MNVCGIAGIVGQEDHQPAAQTVQKMISMLARRGPDGEGIKSWPGVVFGHRRLAIFDLSNAGSQPMVSSDGAVGVVFNGAIYNFLELRNELSSRGCSFVSHTDTEVLLHGYATWGLDDLVRRLRGMFAFALWDNARKRLYLVRDRLGVKPLVYAVRNRVLVFASTVRALSGAGYAGELDARSINAFLEFGFLADDRCIYRDVKKVPAATIVEWSDGNISLRKYWTRPTDSGASEISFREAVDQTRRLLLEAVSARLHADVQVGALLSGGIDSSLVCWAIEELGGDVRAYTVGTPGDPWDETWAAKETAQKLRLKHSVIEMSEDETPAVEELVSAYGEPFGSASALGMLRVCRAISRSSDVKVLLTGDGGDDVFLGYPRHRHFCIAGKLAERLPRAAMQLWESTASCVPRVGPLRRAAALMEYATGGLEGVIDYSRRLQRYEVDYLIGERLRHCCLEEDTRLSRGSGQTLLTDFLEYEFNTRFVGEYMTKVDGATMHYGIEARSPFLDHCMWEFASSLPFDIRLHRGRLKAVLRQLVREEIGRTVAKRPKRGFGIPVQRWVVRRWQPWVEQLLQDSILEADGWIRSGLPLRRLTAAAERGMAPIHLWYIVVLESWVRHERRLRA